MEMSSSPPDASKLRVEDAQGSQVLEVIGGITLTACKMLEETEERDVWLLEMGDDSVFYSDEEQAHLDKDAIASSDFGTNKCRHLVNSVAECENDQQKEDDAGEVVNKEETKTIIQQASWTEEVFQKLQTPQAERIFASDPGESAAGFVKTVQELLQPKCTTVGMETQHGPNKTAEKVKRNVKEEVKLGAQRPNPNPFDVINEESHKRLNREADISQQPSGAELQKSRERQFEMDWETEQSFHISDKFPGSSNPGQSALLPPKRSACSDFNHLTSSKYSTMSYRRIRRGNTRQKIEEFEFMLMNH